MRSMNPTDLRVSDAEREPVIDRLQQAYAEGRLDDGELDLRIQLAMTAKTRGDLAAVTYDLVSPSPPLAPYGSVPVTGEDRMLAGLVHASGYVTTFVGPLVFLLLSGKRSEYVRRHAAEALNFQLTVLLVVMVTFGVGALLYAVTWILALVAGIAGLSGQTFRYPFTLRLVR
ncbi:MAG: hypothetical protein JWN52_7105 [Actinomycetia bacterium]|nr:hypothetical protein [Actinomycetes bacterium]